MNKTFWQLVGLLLIEIFLLIFLITPESVKIIFFGSRAYANQLNLKIKLQGEYDKIENPVFKTKIIFYNQNGTVKQFTDLVAKKETKNIFKIEIDIGGLNLNDRYALFIKPEKFFGRVFCSSSLSGTACTTPQIILRAGENNLDLSQQRFLSGDIDPADGKITAEDLSKIINQIGKTAANIGSLTADINSDQKVEAVDYSLALYSLSKNAVDDTIPFLTNQNSINTPTPTISKSPTTTPTSIPTSYQSPTITPLSTPTSALTPTSTIQSGKCIAKTPPNYGNETVERQNNTSSECECDNYPIIGRLCTKDSCSNCPTGVCDCGTIPEQMPPFTLNCTNGGTYRVEKCNP